MRHGHAPVHLPAPWPSLLTYFHYLRSDLPSSSRVQVVLVLQSDFVPVRLIVVYTTPVLHDYARPHVVQRLTC